MALGYEYIEYKGCPYSLNDNTKLVDRLFHDVPVICYYLTLNIVVVGSNPAYCLCFVPSYVYAVAEEDLAYMSVS